MDNVRRGAATQLEPDWEWLTAVVHARLRAQKEQVRKELAVRMEELRESVARVVAIGGAEEIGRAMEMLAEAERLERETLESLGAGPV